jgi:hypothetical protein
MKAPASRQALSSLNGRSVHAGVVGHELRGLAVHIRVRIQILATEHLNGLESSLRVLSGSSDPERTLFLSIGRIFWRKTGDHFSGKCS